jgi:HAD superfamily hydrolase (TIGR01549 family)
VRAGSAAHFSLADRDKLFEALKTHFGHDWMMLAYPAYGFVRECCLWPRFQAVRRREASQEDWRPHVLASQTIAVDGRDTAMRKSRLQPEALQDVHWLFFDLGNTLVSETAAHACRIERLVETLARFGRRYSIDEVRSALEEAWLKFAPRPFMAVIENLVDDHACHRAVAKEVPYPKELETPYAAAEEVLRTLCTSYMIGVIANQSVSSTERLTKWGLMPYLSTCLCSSELGIEKPDPAIFEMALDRAGCAASEAVIIGDRLDNDIRPARLLGWKTIRILQGYARFQRPRDRFDEPDATIIGLTDLLWLFADPERGSVAAAHGAESAT